MDGDFFEIDFLDVESSKSGDAITMRYTVEGLERIHVVDGGYQNSGESVLRHIRKYYSSPPFIDNAVVTHPDGDHAGGMRTVLEEGEVLALWMLRPWDYAGEIIHRLSRFTNVENLKKRLKECYPNLVALDEIAQRKGIPVHEPFQGAQIGAFTVMAPSKARYLDLIVESERTPESIQEQQQDTVFGQHGVMNRAFAAAVRLVKAAWGVEIFSDESTSAENEMSIVQYAGLCGRRIVLTGDAGRDAMTEAADFAPLAGLFLPGVDRFQVPHHGSRRNMSTTLMDRWLGERLQAPPARGEEGFSAIISAAEKDPDHPRKAVIRACIHRGASVVTTENTNVRTSYNAPDREGWTPITPKPYPEDQEED
jgi:hypothetical protein